MIASTQIANTGIFAFIAVLVLKLLSRKFLLINKRRQQKLLKSRLLFKKIKEVVGKRFILLEKIESFPGKLLQNYK